MATTYLDEAERAHEVLVLDAGAALLSGAPAQVLTDAPGTITRVRQATDPGLAWRRGRQVHQWHPGPPRQDEVAIPVDMEDAVVAAALAHRGRGEAAVTVPAPARNSGCEMLVRAVGLTKKFGVKMVVDEVAIQVAPGEIVGLIGAKGQGRPRSSGCCWASWMPRTAKCGFSACPHHARPARGSATFLKGWGCTGT
jgi:ABC-2 type transport system ATP-binding protein